jgi:hypothetical protein
MAEQKNFLVSARNSLLGSEVEFLDEIQTKSLLFTVTSTALRFLFLQTHPTSYSFYSSVNVHYTM